MHHKLVVYDREAVYARLRSSTSRQLALELHVGQFGERLTQAQARELDEQLAAWAKRALADLYLRDALLVDERRGRRVFSLLCAAHTTSSVDVPAALLPTLPAGASDLTALLPDLVATGSIGALADAARQSLALASLDERGEYPFPADLLALTPLLPSTHGAAPDAFEQPTGWRRRSAALLAVAGMLQLATPLLAGQIPDRPAGLPLALLTLALLVGIRAGWPGYAGSLCIWLVANLPGFRHGTGLASLWPALPLLAAGLLLLRRDRHVRAMWGWLTRLLAP